MVDQSEAFLVDLVDNWEYFLLDFDYEYIALRSLKLAQIERPIKFYCLHRHTFRAKSISCLSVQRHVECRLSLAAFIGAIYARLSMGSIRRVWTLTYYSIQFGLSYGFLFQKQRV